MRKGFLFTGALLAALVGLLAAGVHAAGGSRTVTLAAIYDLDGAQADDGIIVAPADVVDSTSYTIAAQPDVPRPLVGKTAVGANSCIADLVGTLADGTVVTSTLTWTGIAATITPSPDYNFATVTSFTTRVCTGEAAGETIQLGTTSVIPPLYFITWGYEDRMHDGTSVKGIFQWKEVSILVTNGAATTDVTAVTASSAPFDDVSAGDLILFNVEGQIYERKVATRADSDTITINSGVTLPTAGKTFKYKNAYAGPDTEDGWFPVADLAGGSLFVTVLTEQITTDSGFVPTIQCRIQGPGSAAITEVTGADVTAASGVALTAVDFRTKVYDQCRVGLDMKTYDDASDTVIEKITVQVGFNYPGSR